MQIKPATYCCNYATYSCFLTTFGCIYGKNGPFKYKRKPTLINVGFEYVLRNVCCFATALARSKVYKTFAVPLAPFYKGGIEWFTSRNLLRGFRG